MEDMFPFIDIIVYAINNR